MRNKRIFTFLKNFHGVDIENLKLQAKELILDGYSDKEVCVQIISKYKGLENFHPDSLLYYIQPLRISLSEQLEDIVVESIYYKHIATYDKIFRFFRDYGNNIGMRKAITLKNQLTSTIETSGTDIEINNISINDEIEFDFSRLKTEERERLDQLLEKCN